MKYRGLVTNTDSNMEDLISLSNDMAKLEVDQASSDLIIVTGIILCVRFCEDSANEKLLLKWGDMKNWDKKPKLSC